MKASYQRSLMGPRETEESSLLFDIESDQPELNLTSACIREVLADEPISPKEALQDHSKDNNLLLGVKHIKFEPSFPLLPHICPFSEIFLLSDCDPNHINLTSKLPPGNFLRNTNSIPTHLASTMQFLQLQNSTVGR
ncbi:unnamed protein product [Somion occarium]|uniref:Uncharacterized protein n=1 Tax=Somion occarium TaxID=3059160 RepID=A0ABP1E790_9APHY